MDEAVLIERRCSECDSESFVDGGNGAYSTDSFAGLLCNGYDIAHRRTYEPMAQQVCAIGINVARASVEVCCECRCDF